MQNHWNKLAEHWSKIKSPLHPNEEDLQRFQKTWLDTLPNAPVHVDVLVLGVTPELVSFPWAPETKLTAVDNNEDMIRLVWLGDTENRKVIQGNWLELPVEDSSFDLIVSDNAPCIVGDLEKFSKELRRVIRPDGRIVMRNFSRPDEPETIDQLVAEINAGNLKNFYEFKMRFDIALQGKTGKNVRLGDMWTKFNELFPDRDLLASQLECTRGEVDNIDIYKDINDTYAFYTIEEMVAGFPEFTVTVGPEGHYDFADRCPIYSLIPKSN